MSTDPRHSADPFVRSALGIWDITSIARDVAYADATNLREELSQSANHQAYGWALATCGRVAAYRERLDLAEAFLTEALGRFFLVGDGYGKALVTAHLAIPQLLRGNLDRSLELALEPFLSGIRFQNQDLAILHNLAALCYHERGEFHAALFQLNAQYAIIRQSGATDQLPKVVANMGALLVDIGEFDLALAALGQAWELEQARGGTSLIATLVPNIFYANCQLGRLDVARSYVELFTAHIESNAGSDCTYLTLLMLAEARARLGSVDLAREILGRARNSAKSFSEGKRKWLLWAEAAIAEAEGDLVHTIELCHHALELENLTTVKKMDFPRAVADVLTRCYTRLGDRKSAENWARFGKEAARANLLSDILSHQIRTNLRLQDPAVKLTDQELNCLRLSANGQTSSDIGLKLGIKPRTVNFHFSKILRKLNAINRQEAIAKASNSNLLN
jgi:DNA-binding CsgD family transcriptional regulator